MYSEILRNHSGLFACGGWRYVGDQDPSGYRFGLLA